MQLQLGLYRNSTNYKYDYLKLFAKKTETARTKCSTKLIIWTRQATGLVGSDTEFNNKGTKLLKRAMDHFSLQFSSFLSFWGL